AKRIFMEIIEELDARYASADEKRLIASARINLVRYMGRHLSRTFDHAFVDLLSQRKNALKEMRRTFRQMAELDVPMFSSAPLYVFLGLLPFCARSPILDAMKNYKVKKWCH
ncbi:MAG TPA: hypothetical protein VL688_02750, partial [Verrucomicrobiae bacterium]|nr:hypothetical protein [Verrucomicrobiae bacterium]